MVIRVMRRVFWAGYLWIALSTLSLAAPPGSEPVYHEGDLYLPTSQVFVRVDKKGLGHLHGVVGRMKSGAIHLGATQNAGEIVFDMTTFEADTPAARKYVGLEEPTDDSTRQKVTANMLSSEVLDVAQYPEAVLKIDSATPLAEPGRHGEARYELTGELTLHGVSRPVQIPIDVESKNGWNHIRGGLRLTQSHFGITPISKMFGAIAVANDLRVYGDIWVAPSEGSARTAAK